MLEAELNAAKIYDYRLGRVNRTYLDRHLRWAGRARLSALLREYTLFSCSGWIREEDGTVHRLASDGLQTGLREPSPLDAAYVRGLIGHAGNFLQKQTRPDGSFLYGLYPQFDREMETYNIVRHAGAVWALICCHRLFPGPALRGTIEQAIAFLLAQTRRDASGAAFVHGKKPMNSSWGPPPSRSSP